MAGADVFPPPWNYIADDEDSDEVTEAAEQASIDIPSDENQEWSVQCIIGTNEGDPARQECRLVVDRNSHCLQIDGKTVRKIRYVGLHKYGTMGYVCVLSWADLSWQTAEDLSLMFLYFQLPEDNRLLNSMKAINSIRRLQYEQVMSECTDASSEETVMDVLSFLRLLLLGDLTCSVNEEAEKNYFSVTDRECLCLFPYPFAEQPIKKLFFWKEEGPNVVEMVMMVHGKQSIKIECPNTKLTIPYLNTGISKEFVSLLRKVVNSKPKRVFRDYKELYGLMQMEQTARKGGVLKPTKSLALGGPSTQGVEVATWENPAGFSGSYAKQYMDELDTAEEKCKAMPVYEDMIAPMWIAAEEEMRNLLEASFVPRSEFDSGGFDPNNFEHLQKCLQDAEEKMMEQTYDMALSRVIGARKTFAKSSERQIREIFEGNDDIALLKKIYMRNFSLSQ